MYWQYLTMLFEFRKDGLLGDKYIDDEEIEHILNDHGKRGWELVNVTPVREGLLAFLKKEAVPGIAQLRAEPAAGTAAAELNAQEKVRKLHHAEDKEEVESSGKKKPEIPAPGGKDSIGGIKIS
ncbi:MAG: DUF4177 domain-containing protein [Desulfobulbaceae bacterium]|nr:DUF4177 domain-containing protein [Desulfobulbaceae bacterium]